VPNVAEVPMQNIQRTISQQSVGEAFPGVKRPRRGVDHTPTSTAEVEETVDLYLFPPPFS
jgi:hypothetical protein